jgi:hypothetical protein
MATFLPPVFAFPNVLTPKEWAVAQELLLKAGVDLIEPSSADERPDDALTERAEASSINRRIFITEQNTPGSI